MNDTEYIEKRVDDQIEWYSDKSGWNQKLYKRLRILEILCASSIPFIVSYVTGETISLKIIVTKEANAVNTLFGLYFKNN